MAQQQSRLPDDRTIAFAAAIISSKPDNLAVREYISLLTRHVAKGRRENALSAAYRHLDRSAYWRAECERAKTAFRAAELARLEALRDVDLLKTKLEATRTAAAVGGVKRKRANADVVPYSREIKKGSKDREEKREVFLGGLVIEEVEFAEGDVGGQSLMRMLFQIGLFFKPGSSVGAKDLSCHLCLAATEIAKVVVHSLDRQKSISVMDGVDLTATMTAAGRVFAAVLAGSQKLARLDISDVSRGQVTYALVHMYKSLLAAFDTISREEALTRPAGLNCDPKASAAKVKPKPKGGTTRVNIRDVPLLNAAAGLLSGMIKQLDAKQDHNKEIFEGFLYYILCKLGDRIYTINFSRARAATIAAELDDTSSSEDGTVTDGTTPAHNVPLAVRQAQLEAPYLLHLLKQALALTPSFLSSPGPGPGQNSKATKTKPNPKPGSVTKSTLTHAAKERLQATLVGAIFGPEDIDEESDFFINALQMPEAGAGGMTVPRVKEAEVGEWFQGEVWRLLGWEVLGREMNTRLRDRQ